MMLLGVLFTKTNNGNGDSGGVKKMLEVVVAVMVKVMLLVMPSTKESRSLIEKE